MTEKFCGGFPIVTSTKYPYVTYMNKKFNANWRKQFWYFYFVFHLTQRFFYRHISFDIWWWGLNQLSSPNSRRKCFIVGAKFYSKSLSRPNIHGFSNFKDHGFLSVLNFVHPDFASKYIGSSVLPALQLPLPPHFSKVGFPKIKSVNKYFASSYHFQFCAEHFWYFSFVSSRYSSSYLLFLLQRNMCLVRCVERKKIKKQSGKKIKQTTEKNPIRFLSFPSCS